MSLGITGGNSIPGDTPGSILAKLKTVAGIGSGLDADLVRGQVIDVTQFPSSPLASLAGFSSSAIPQRTRNTYPNAWFGG